jgi:hypothetical protein
MAPAQPAIANYDDQAGDQVTQRLRTLSQADLAKLEAYERVAKPAAQCSTRSLRSASGSRGPATTTWKSKR